jgi:hypothetical protein
LSSAAPAFPGRESFAALVSHLRFVRDHHRRIKRIAIVPGSTMLSIEPNIANHFASAPLQTFPNAERAPAPGRRWAARRPDLEGRRAAGHRDRHRPRHAHGHADR